MKRRLDARRLVRALVAAIGLAVLGGAGVAADIDVAAESARIDALVDAGLAAQKIAPNAPVSDTVFLRRIYLDCIGRIPTYNEANAFITDPSPRKRAALIANLQASEGWVSHQFNWWADLLRVQSRPTGGFSGEPYIDWLKQQIRADLPYDVMVRDLITAKGRTMERGNGATGYYVRDANMAMDNMSNTVQVFLGTRLACAQCHDHPFDTWTRMNYMQMAAFTNTTNAAPNQDFVKALRKLAKDDKGPGDAVTQEEKNALRRISQTVALEVTDKKTDTINLPKDYQYPDAKPNQTVHAHVLFGDLAIKSGEEPRTAYAEWLTAPDNPRFTEVIANRMWKKAFGLGLIEPVDNLTDATVAAEPELMAHLTDLMKRCGYDLKTFQAILYNTRAYQRCATAVDVNPGDPYYFPGPLLRRLGAEEVWDSLLTLVVPDLDARNSNVAERVYAYFDEMKSKTPDEIWAMISGMAGQLKERHDIQEQIKAMIKQAGSRDALRGNADFQKLVARERELGNGMANLNPDRRPDPKDADNDTRWKGFRPDLMRASELPSPAPPGHLLRDFGQSDRMLIDNATSAAALTQALNLLNGFVDGEVLRPHSVLIQTLAAQAAPEAKARAAFICILGREPTAKELAWAMTESARADAPAAPATGTPATGTTATGGNAGAPDRQRNKGPNGAGIPKGQADVLWSLINTDEFLFEQ
jgi:hypothetical protein